MQLISEYKPKGKTEIIPITAPLFVNVNAEKYDIIIEENAIVNIEKYFDNSSSRSSLRIKKEKTELNTTKHITDKTKILIKYFKNIPFEPIRFILDFAIKIPPYPLNEYEGINFNIT